MNNYFACIVYCIILSTFFSHFDTHVTAAPPSIIGLSKQITNQSIYLSWHYSSSTIDKYSVCINAVCEMTAVSSFEVSTLPSNTMFNLTILSWKGEEKSELFNDSLFTSSNPVRNFRVANISSRSVQLAWDNPINNGTESLFFTVCVVEEEWCKQVNDTCVIFPLRFSSFLYTFTIQARNSYQNQTVETISLQTITPPEAMINFEAATSFKTNIWLQWRIPPSSSKNASFLFSICTATTPLVCRYNITDTFYEFDGLAPYSVYQFSLQAMDQFNQMSPLVFTTFVTAAPPPTNFSITPFANFAIFTWIPVIPILPNSSLSYQVSILRGISTITKYQATGNSFLVNDLEIQSSYTAEVRTILWYKNKRYTSILTFATSFRTLLAKPPTKAPETKVELVKSTEVILSVTPLDILDMGGATVTNYTILLIKSDAKGKLHTIDVGETGGTVTIKNLIPGSAYQAFGVCYNIAGTSDTSAVQFITLLDEHNTNDATTAITVTVVVTLVSLCTLLCGLLCFVSITVFVILLFLRKKKTNKSYEQLVELNLLEKLVEKEFRIEESKLDWSSSQFIGAGASGSVITAKYYNIDVAVKVVPRQLSGLDNNLKDFYNELEFLNSSTHHINIIRFFGVYENNAKNHIGLVMEYCPNGSLASYIAKQKSLSFSTKVNIIQGIANGMQYLHYHNIAHRDLKCENVLLDSSLTPKIIDFGFSRVISQEAKQVLTMNIGTAVYCAPEVVKNQIHNSSENVYDKSCDVYSFGILIYVVYFQTNTPYGSVSDNQVLMKLLHSPTFRPNYDRSVIPEQELWLLEMMEQCWSTAPVNRPTFNQICSIMQRKCEK